MHGMEWNGMEWNGMKWNGMEWNGMEWQVMESKGKLESQLESGKSLYTYKSRFFEEVPD